MAKGSATAAEAVNATPPRAPAGDPGVLVAGAPPYPTALGPCLRVLLVDDHAGVRESLSRSLQQAAGAGWQIVQAECGAQALDLLDRQELDVAVVDMSMPGMNGLELIGELGRRRPGLPCLMLSMHDEEPYALRAFKAGARGYMMKDQVAAQIVPALRRLHAGGFHLTPAVAEKLLMSVAGGIEAARRSRLTPREFDVLQRISLGESSDPIAQALDLSASVIDACRQRASAALGMALLCALVSYGRELGFAREQSLQAAGTEVPKRLPSARPMPKTV